MSTEEDARVYGKKLMELVASEPDRAAAVTYLIATGIDLARREGATEEQVRELIEIVMRGLFDTGLGSRFTEGGEA